MRRIAALVAVALLVPLAPPARAQMGGFERHGGGRRDRDRYARADSSVRTLSGRYQVWGHAGFSWLGTPPDSRALYNPGLGAAVSAERRFADRLGIGANLEYHDLPSKAPSVVYINGYPYLADTNVGHGWLGLAMATASVRVWNHVWLEGDGGGGYFGSGYSQSAYTDTTTGTTVHLAASGWGGVVGGAARYEFQPTRRDRLLAEVQFLSLDREGVAIHFWAIRTGYRFF